MRRTALIFRERLVAPSETFIVDQARTLRRFVPVLTGLRRSERTLQHRLPEVLLRRGSGPADKAAARLFRHFRVAPAFFHRLGLLKPSILHAHFAMDGVCALPIANALNLPLVVSLHGYDVTPPDEELSKSFSGRHYLAQRKDLFARASAFVCVSESIRNTAIRRGFPEAKLRVHYTGVDCSRFRPSGVERDAKLIVFVGRLVEIKGCEYLLRAMALVQQKEPDAHVEIIGDGPLRPQLEALAKELGIRARFRGVLSPDEVQHAMTRARVLCNPSVTAEGFGMVFAEAQAVGTPVVSSMHSAIPEAVCHGRTGLLCPERSVDSLSDALLTFLRNEGFWTQASGRAVTWVQNHFDLAKQASRLEALYDDCIDNY